MKYAIATLSALAWAAVQVNAAACTWCQCGGMYYSGDTDCAAGSTCVYNNDWYSQCIPGGNPTTTTTTSTTTTTTTTKSPTTTTTTTTTTSKSTTTTSKTSTTTTTTGCPPTSTPAAGSGKSAYFGVNIAGFDFGCGVDGTCGMTAPNLDYPPLASLGNPDGIGQMQHFRAGGMNTFRLPVGWQRLVNGNLGGTLDASYWVKYDQLVQGCLATGAYCIIDIHNYARWNGNIIGQSNGAVTNSDFSSLWSQIATKYAGQSKVIFGLMNEPHDVPDITIWAASVQAAVTAIRQAGATSQLILMPGNNWTSAGTFVSSGSADALSKVTNPDGSIDNLIFDVHKYLDSDNSGTHTECVTDNVSDTFAPLAQWLRCHGRKAILTESGGGNVQSCVTYFCSQLDFIRTNSDVFLGYTGWSAGSFDSTYTLTETPQNGQDTLLVKSCLYQSGSTTTTTSATTTTSTTSSTKTSTSTTTKTSTTSTKTSTTSTPSGSGSCSFGNPYENGYTAYLSPYYIAEVNAAIATQSSSTLKTKSAKVAQIPNFTWFDTADKVPTLGDYLADARSMQADGTKMILQIVVYDLPDRDCHAKASNGEYHIAQNGVANYKAYIDAIKSYVVQYPDVRIVAVVEPDSLANLVTNMSDSHCANAHDAYLQCTTYALQQLNQCNIWLYLDAGHAGWLGWQSNQDPAAQLFAQVYKSATPNRVRGLATNVANYNALHASTPDPITQGDPCVDELSYVQAMSPRLTNYGFPAHFIIDQGRSGVQNIRGQWGDWCNIKGAGFGMRPTNVTPDPVIDAIVWVKPGGECDGTSDSSSPRYDSTCSLSDAKQPAPEAGTWFEAYFEDLVNFANPAL